MISAVLSRPTLLAARADLCLDYANTRYWRGSETATEELHALADVIAWHGSRQLLPPDAISALGAWWRDWPRQESAAFAEALSLREALYRMFSAVAAGDAPDAADLESLNRALARTPPRAHLHDTGSGFAWQVP